MDEKKKKLFLVFLLVSIGGAVVFLALTLFMKSFWPIWGLAISSVCVVLSLIFFEKEKEKIFFSKEC